MGMTYNSYYYHWKDRTFPYFYPADDDWRGEGYFIVEFALTCYPYARGSQFDENAFPHILRRLGHAGSTKFYFVAHDKTGEMLTGLSWEEACDFSNELNACYENILDDCAKTWQWHNLDYDIDLDDLRYNK